MSGVNKVILIGNLGGDPELRYFPSGEGLANLRLATSETWKDRNSGQPQEHTEWHRVVVRGKLADVVKNYLRKGSKVYVEGKLHTRKWQDQSGQDRYTTEIQVGGIGTTLQMLDGRGSGEAGGGRSGGTPAAGGGYGRGAPPAEDADQCGDLDDIPF